MYKEIQFEKVDGKSKQIFILYELLKNRKFNISHKSLPNFEDHELFVKKNPYRVWYLVFNNKKPVGSFYLKYDNSVGLKLSLQEISIVDEIISFIKNNFNPEKEIPSETTTYFYINISTENNELKDILEEINLKPLQISYKFKN